MISRPVFANLPKHDPRLTRTGLIPFPGSNGLETRVDDYAPTVQIPHGVAASLAVVVAPPGEAEGSGVLARPMI